jgi:hypothetical protein
VAATFGMTALCMMGTGSRTRLMEKGFTSGPMVVDTRDSGRTTTCMEEGSTPGRMAASMRAST